MDSHLAIIAVPYGHSWPWQIGHWWLTLTAADQGAWVSGLGAFAAAAVALRVAGAESKRRRVEAKARARIVMASYSTPMMGVYAMVIGIRDDAIEVASAMAGEAIVRIGWRVERIKNGCDIMRPLLATFSHAEAFHLPDEFGPQLATAVRDAELLVGLATSVTDVYFERLPHKDYGRMLSVCKSMKGAESYAQSILDRLAPFIKACEKELGVIGTEAPTYPEAER